MEEEIERLDNRVALIWIRDASQAHAEEVENEHWKEAYKDLARAADRLDAMIARNEVSSFGTTE